MGKMHGGDDVEMTSGEWVSPEWPNEYFRYVHDWRRYISADMRAAWDTFTDDQKRMIFENAEAQADAEEWE